MKLRRGEDAVPGNAQLGLRLGSDLRFARGVVSRDTRALARYVDTIWWARAPS